MEECKKNITEAKREKVALQSREKKNNYNNEGKAKREQPTIVKKKY